VRDLVLRRSNESRAGADGPDDYDVIGINGEVVGRIFKATHFPNDTPWQWSLAYGFLEERTHTHGLRGDPGGGYASIRAQLA
jgi:hypothetical protein